jgi:hypothetical protein
MITNAKQKVDYFNKSPAKVQGYRSTSTEKVSPRKKILARSFEEEIHEILESKWKIEGINDRRASLGEYLITYFTMKYGKPQATQKCAEFREAVSFLAKQQEKHIFVLFQAVLDQECD